MYPSIKHIAIFKVSTKIVKKPWTNKFLSDITHLGSSLKGLLYVYRVVPHVKSKYNTTQRLLWFFANHYPFQSSWREKISRGAGWNKDEDSGLEIRMKRAKSLKTAIDGDEQAISLFIWDFCIWWSRGNSIESVPGPISTSRLGVRAVFSCSHIMDPLCSEWLSGSWSGKPGLD